ncbi:hypothetical protein [Agromyces arachidis]|uniref:hypothetical protein n=1 Tax=Agromyces arachidis TaxID=766966 RepID=UPI004057C541
MDHAAGFVAMQVHDVNVRRAEERIAIERAAAERGEGGSRGRAAATAGGLRRARRARTGTPLPAR